MSEASYGAAAGPLLGPGPAGRWDAFAIGTPCIVPMPDGRLRMYYIGSNEVAESCGIDEFAMRHQSGLAVTDGCDPTRWRRHEG